MSCKHRIRALVVEAALTLTSGVAGHAAEETAKPVFAYALPNLPGRTATGVLVTYAPLSRLDITTRAV